VQLLEFSHLFELVLHISSDHFLLVLFFLLLPSLLLRVLSADQLLEKVVSETFHQIKLELEYDNAIVGLFAPELGLPVDELSHLADFLEENTGNVQIAIKGEDFERAVDRVLRLRGLLLLVVDNFVD
jgi:hypothetical protein